jgi:23S rRNA pseudouridine1911/1915/1917 synthase
LNEACRQALAQRFAERKIFKEYLALVHGVPKPSTGRINAPVGRDPARKTRMAVTASGRPAESAYRVLYADPAGRFALTAVRIFTGRTHQVRVHMRSIGHPLIGDALYADPRRVVAGKHPAHPASDRKLSEPFRPGRQMLHAHKLAFAHPFHVSIPSRLHPPTDSVPADRSRVDCPLPEGRGYQEGMPGCAGRQGG